MIRAVLFDVGGVLHTSEDDAALEKSFAEQALAALAAAGAPLEASPEVFLARVASRAKEYKRWSEETTTELPAAEIWNRYFLRDFAPPPEKVASCAERLCDLYDGAQSRITPRPHLLETMHLLRARGLRLGVISNIISRAFVPECLERYGIAPLMECVVLSSVLGRRKPAPEIFAAATNALGLPAKECAYVGDRLSRDVIGARRAGFGRVIQIRFEPSIQKDKAFEGLGYAPDVMIDGLEEIPGIIQAANL